MGLKRLVTAMVLAVSVAGPVRATEDAPAGVTAAWRAGEEKGTGTLTLRFASGTAQVDARSEPWGLDVWVPAAIEGDPRIEGARVIHENPGTRIRIETPGIKLLAVRSAGGLVTIELSVPETAPASALASSAGVPYQIGIGDVVSVAVYKEQDLSGDLTVGPDGTITVPLVGPVRAAGRSEAQLADDLTRVLARDYLVSPQVGVTVKTYQSQYIYVAGSVARAGRVALKPGMILKDVLSEAGVALVPGQEVLLNRTGAAGGESIRLEASALDAANAPVPRDGDVLVVQEPSYVFLHGEVRRPGRLVVTPGMTLLQAITMSEGLTDWASKKDVRILRKVDGETRDEIVNLKKVEDREIADPQLAPGDIIHVRRRIL